MEMRLLFIFLAEYIYCDNSFICYLLFPGYCSQCFRCVSSWRNVAIISESAYSDFRSYKCELEAQQGMELGPKSPGW